MPDVSLWRVPGRRPERTGYWLRQRRAELAIGDMPGLTKAERPNRLHRSLFTRIFLEATNCGARAAPSKMALRAKVMALSIS